MRKLNINRAMNKLGIAGDSKVNSTLGSWTGRKKKQRVNRKAEKGKEKMQRKEKKRRTAPGNEIEELRRKARESAEKELIRDAMRAREFSGVETLLEEKLELIDFVLKARGTNAVF